MQSVSYQNQGDMAALYAHTDIAFEFASWISPEFKLYIIKDYQRLKKDEANRLDDWMGCKERTFKNKLSYSYRCGKRIFDNTDIISARKWLIHMLQKRIF